MYVKFNAKYKGENITIILDKFRRGDCEACHADVWWGFDVKELDRRDENDQWSVGLVKSWILVDKKGGKWGIHKCKEYRKASGFEYKIDGQKRRVVVERPFSFKPCRFCGFPIYWGWYMKDKKKK